MLIRKLTSRQIEAKIAAIERILPDLTKRLSACSLCPRHCGVNRLEGETGECGMDTTLRVASVARHTGEEPPVSGDSGAINVFFSGCNLHCLHCQNWPISQQKVGRTLTIHQLAQKILSKGRQGAQSLGWVTPTPQLLPALQAYSACLHEGFDLPLVYNTGGYESREILHLLAGIVDIWLPDAKTFNQERSRQIQGVGDYPEINLTALDSMVEQVTRKKARAVIVRHLVLPGGVDDSKTTLGTLWRSFGNKIYLSLMVQYFPFYKTLGHPTLHRRLTHEEYEEIVHYCRDLGFEHGWIQQYDLQTGISPDCLS